MLRLRFCLLGIALAVSYSVSLFCPTSAWADAVEENFPDGKAKAKFTTSTDGKRDGDYLEYFENGKPKIKSKYAAGELDGPYFEYFENGKVRVRSNYKSGKLNGKYQEMNERGQPEINGFYVLDKQEGLFVHFENGKPDHSDLYKMGELISPRTAAEIKTKLTAILSKPKDATDAALRQLAAYRYICGLPYENLTIDDEYTKEAQAAAHVLEKLGKLDHNPPNPGGLSDEEYELGRKGAGRSNLSSGNKNLVEAVDGWMDDSDKSNIDRLGHRRWLINPAMLKTGFGASGKFFTVYAFDNHQPKVPDYDFVAYPPRGIVPTEFFKASAAWSVSLNSEKFAKPDDKTEPKIYLVDDRFEKVGSPLPLNYLHVDHGGYGINNCIIFQPDKSVVAPGRSFLVEIPGLYAKDGKTPADVHYFVQFVSLSK